MPKFTNFPSTITLYVHIPGTIKHFRKYMNHDVNKISREDYRHQNHKGASYPCTASIIVSQALPFQQGKPT